MDSRQITFLYATDLDASRRFYEEAIGLELVQVQEAGCRIYRSGPGSFLGVCKTRPDRPSGGAGVVICFVVETEAAVDEAAAKFTAAGVPTDGAPRWNGDFDIYHFYCRDPDGYVLEVQCFKDRNWAGDE